jgi:SAM-dependent methyltransferase
MNTDYWNREGAAKTFTHELFPKWVKDIPVDCTVLDFGCGYGRITKQLHSLGFENIIGFDTSSSMISRARAENKGPRYTSQIRNVLKHKYGLVICFALFTSCPDPEAQLEIKEIIDKQTSNTSCLYISDYLISENPHYSEKYEQKALGIFGCFGTIDTVLFRHHEKDHFSKLFSEWTLINRRTIAGKTMNGNKINMSQLLYKKG